MSSPASDGPIGDGRRGSAPRGGLVRELTTTVVALAVAGLVLLVLGRTKPRWRD